VVEILYNDDLLLICSQLQEKEVTHIARVVIFIPLQKSEHRITAVDQASTCPLPNKLLNIYDVRNI
jgi:hypothetical protein